MTKVGPIYGWRDGRVRAVAIFAVMVVSLICIAAAPSTAAAGWPLYGHDLTNSRTAETAGPSPTQAGSLARKWTFMSPTGDFTATPVVSHGVLVAGDYGGAVYALNAETGKVLWSKKVGAPVVGTAAIDPRAGAVYVPVAEIGSPSLVALSLHSGKRLWQTTLIRHQGADVFGSPVYWQRQVYIGTSGPNTDNTTARGSVVALDKRTGKIRWRTFTVPRHRDGAAVWSTPAIDTRTGRLYVGTGNNYHEPTTDTEDSMMALSTSTGRILGHFQATANDSFSLPGNPAGPDLDFGASPNLLRGPHGRRLVGEGQKSGIYWALDRATMRPVWHRQVGPGSPIGGFLGSTAYDGARIYGANTLSGQVFALTPGGGMPWQSLDSGGLHWSPVAVANGVLYSVDPEGFLNARNAATGAILTKVPLGGPNFAGISAAGENVYVAVGTGPPPDPAPQADGQGSIIAFTGG